MLNMVKLVSLSCGARATTKLPNRMEPSAIQQQAAGATEQLAATTEAAGVVPSAPLPPVPKKRKPNANGPRRTSRRTVARDCLQLHLEEKDRLKVFFKSDCSRVALTTDCWTSVQNLNYLTLTAHFIDNAWNYQKRIISFAVVPNHKGETVGRKIEEVLRDWGIRNVSTITVDNASSNDVAVSYLKKKLKNMSGLLLDGLFLHVRCCAHILNLVVNDGLREMHQSICNIRDAVRYVRSSSQRTAKFKEFVEFSGIVCKKLLCLDVQTRWNSTYLMLSVAEKFQAVFDKLEDEETSYREWLGVEGPPTSLDWENVRHLVVS